MADARPAFTRQNSKVQPASDAQAFHEWDPSSIVPAAYVPYFPDYFPWSPHWDHPEAIYSGESIRYLGGNLRIIVDGTGQNAWYRMSVNADQFNGTDADETVWGRQGDDILYGNGGRDMLLGEAGNDQLEGGAGRDLLDGGSGSDILLGGDGGDLMSGGDDDDYLYGEAGNDEIYGDAGNDVISGGAGYDCLDGGDGIDTVAEHNGNVEANLEAGYARKPDGFDRLFNFENIETGEGNDRLIGDSHDNNLDGGGGDDRLYGQGGNDTLDGGQGNDALSGGQGNDMLIASIGEGESDTLNGGAGADVFKIQGTRGLTVIEDFHSGEDILDLTWFRDSLPAGYDVGSLLDSARETPQGLLLTVTTELDPGEFQESHILLNGISRSQINAGDIRL